MFEAPMALAEKILTCGYFTVELEGRNLWSLRINREITEVERKRLLRSAAQAWEDKLGPLDMCDAVTGSWADELRRQKEKQNAKLV